VWMLRIVGRNGAIVVRAALIATLNRLGLPLVARRMLPKALARGSLAVMLPFADRSGVIVAQILRTAMRSQLGHQMVALLCLRFNMKPWRPAQCNVIGIFGE